MNKVLVLDTNYTPLAPCHPARAKMLLNRGKAAVYRQQPFTIILKYTVDDPKVDHLELKVDPGSKTTGMALVSHGQRGSRVIFGLNLVHRGHLISKKLTERAMYRSNRRSRNTRYRPVRFNNRGKTGKIAPSLVARLLNLQTWFKRFIKFTGVSDMAIEIAKFDMQKMRNPDIKGKGYQQGTLFGYEVKEYLLVKYRHCCQYCKGVSKDKILEVDHIFPRSKGGSNAVSNLVISCHTCNQSKSNHSLSEWSGMQDKTKLGKTRIQQCTKVTKGIRSSLRDTTLMNILMPRILSMADLLNFTITGGYGYQTKYNRSQQKHRKDHWIDAACVGDTGKRVFIPKGMKCLTATSTGYHNRRMVRTDRYGFPRTLPKGPSVRDGMRKGDIVQAVIPRGKYQGSHIGRCTHFSGGLMISSNIPVASKHCRVIQSADGYQYHQGTSLRVFIDKGLNNKSIKRWVKTRFTKKRSQHGLGYVDCFI